MLLNKLLSHSFSIEIQKTLDAADCLVYSVNRHLRNSVVLFSHPLIRRSEFLQLPQLSIAPHTFFCEEQRSFIVQFGILEQGICCFEIGISSLFGFHAVVLDQEKEVK